MANVKFESENPFAHYVNLIAVILVSHCQNLFSASNPPWIFIDENTYREKSIILNCTLHVATDHE